MAHINLIPGEQGVRLSTLSPKYLHTNSTSHTWPFSAIAELIDNAYDPDVDASQLWIDVERYGFEQSMVFTDNGAGMDSLKLHKMLSFGFCEKVAKNDHLPVGHYGNGFKSGSMRLGKDALVFTKFSNSRSVGFLSQTYLEAVKAQTILVPIVSWDAEDNVIERADGDKALQDILTHSLFKTKNDLMQQFNKIKSPTGTRIIISNMRRTQEGKYEFDFRTNPEDVRIPDDIELENNKYKRIERQNHIPTSDYSLRAYCSILYLKPRMQIILRGKKVTTIVIAKSLSKTEVDTYKPQGVNKPIKVTFGFSQNKNHYGIMMYHRNRLIKPYVRVGYQLKANNYGVGVIGVIQCDYLQPTHNKQDFDYTKAFRSSMSALGSKLNDYWNEKKGKAQTNSNTPVPEPKEVEQTPDQLWVQCDNPECLKWRKLPPSVTSASLPEKWYCTDHPEEKWRSCDVPEELEDEREDAPQPYVKKQKKRLERELEEKRRREKAANKQREQELELRNRQLKKKDAEIEKLIQIVQQKGQQQEDQKQKETVKRETGSPHNITFKIVSPLPSKRQSITQTTAVSRESKVVLSPVPKGQAATMAPSPLTSPTGQGGRSVRVMSTANTKPQTSTTSVQLVKVVGSPSGQPIVDKQNKVVAINLGTVTTSKPGLQPKVSGPPVVIKVGSKAAAEQVKFLPTMVPVTAVVDPKVLSVQSLAGKTQPSVSGQANVLIKSIASPTNPTSVGDPSKVPIAATTPVANLGTLKVPIATSGVAIAPKASIVTPGISKAPPQVSIATPQVSTATAVVKPGSGVAASVPEKPTPSTPKYVPLESLKEVNRQATLTTISPVTAVMDERTTTKQPQQQAMTVIRPAPIGHQDVTVNNRYRYIAPTGQAVPQAAQSSASMPSSRANTVTQQVIVLQQVKQESQLGASSLAATAQEVNNQQSSTAQTQKISIKTEPTSDSPDVSGLKRRHESTDDGPVARKLKAETDVIIIDPPSPPQDNICHYENNFDDDTSLPNMDDELSNMDTGTPNKVCSPNKATPLPNKESSPPNKGVLSPNMDIGKPQVEEILKVHNMIDIDKDIIEEVNLMSPQQQLQALFTRSQQLKQLYSLRQNVLKLLQVLVPELEVNEFKGKYKDQTVDDLLRQVLEQAEKTDAIIDS